MKIMTSYRSWIPLGVITVLIISAGILLFPNVINLFKLHWIILIAVLFICCTPFGNKHFGMEQGVQKRAQLWAWLIQIFFFQLCLAAVFLGIFIVCAVKVPTLTTPQPNLLKDTLYQMLVTQGLFPWAGVALLAVSFSFWSYQKNQDAYFANTLMFFMKKPALNIITNYIGRFATQLAFALTLSLISLLWASFIGNSSISTGFALAPMLTSAILVLFSMSKMYSKYLNKTLGRDLPLIIGLFLWTLFFAAAIWLVNGFMVLLGHAQFPPPKLLSNWINQPWNKTWSIFANSWWLLWMPITAITMARISRGYSVRSIILAILFLPLLASITLLFTTHDHWEASSILSILTSGIGLLGIFIFTLRKTGVPAFILNYLPRRDHYKFRSYRRTFIQLTKIAVITFFLYLPSGIILLHYLLFSVAWPILLLCLLATFSTVLKVY